MLNEIVTGFQTKFESLGYPVLGTDCSLILDVEGWQNKKDYLKLSVKTTQFPIIILNYRQGKYTVSGSRNSFLMNFPGQVALVCKASSVKTGFEQCANILFKTLLPKLFEVPTFLIESDYVQLNIGDGLIDVLNEDIENEMYVAGMVNVEVVWGKTFS